MNIRFLLVALLAAASMADEAVITRVNVISMLEPGVLTDRDVTVRDGRIVAVGAGGSAETSDGTLVIDGADRFLIPGLAEMHAHVPVEPEYRDEVLFLWVANGVTLARGMLGHPDHLVLRDDLLAHRVLGPRLITSGPSFSGRTAGGPAAVAARVRAQQRDGYDFLKIHPGLTVEEFDALVAAAREVGIGFAGHVTAAVGLWPSLEAGQTTVDHLDGYFDALVREDTDVPEGSTLSFGLWLTPFVDPDRIPAVAERSRALGGAVVPTETLSENTTGTHRWRAMTERPEFRYLPAELRENYVVRVQRAALAVTPETGAEYLALRKRLIVALHDAGVPVLLGSDSPQVFNVPGFSIHRELEAMVAAGLTPYEALATGTTAPAAFLRTADWGAIAPGRDADLVLLEADPLADIANTRKIAGVMVRGRWLDRAEIDAGLAAIAERHR
ncbi:MAG: amidohydrolase family protein [Gammaproteobacteria bacterium]|nr:amidohydrolase family protein [Gammaproteobacteria bacterium]